MRKPLTSFLMLIAAPTLAWADVEPRCEELWFARNAMLDDAGYCFTSPLGRSVFDNADCTSQAPAVTGDVAQQVSIIQQLERDPPFSVRGGQCQVNVNMTRLDDVPYLEQRRRLTFQPALAGRGEKCRSYQGSPFLIHAAPDVDAEILGEVRAGYSLSLSHLPWNDWNFAVIRPEAGSDQDVVLGWYQVDIEDSCAFVGG